MVRSPAIEVLISPTKSFGAIGELAHRATNFASRWADYHDICLETLGCRLEIRRHPPSHSGLGSGTQLALAVAALLHAWRGEPIPGASELARSVGRGRRSAIGSHGFHHGGLILDAGKPDGESVGRLETAMPIPANWRWILWLERSRQGLAGHAEDAAFSQLMKQSTGYDPRLPNGARAVIEAAQANDFNQFSRGLYEFGYRAGMQFAPIQGGPYNGAVLTQRIERLRCQGVAGVGQSSWGPTIFAVAESEQSARSIAQLTLEDPVFHGTEIVISQTANDGMSLEILPH